jgi:hypothetical protein
MTIFTEHPQFDIMAKLLNLADAPYHLTKQHGLHQQPQAHSSGTPTVQPIFVRITERYDTCACEFRSLHLVCALPLANITNKLFQVAC